MLGMRAVVLGLFLAIAACSSKPSGKTVRVGAASDLAKAMEEIAKEFEARTQIKPLIDFGSSGLLAKQIEQGAPYFLYMAANKSFAEQVVAAGRCDGSTSKLYARGRIVVWTPMGVAAPVKLSDLTDARFKRIAIANPDHAPYGVAAKQALDKAGVWEQLVWADVLLHTGVVAPSGDRDGLPNVIPEAMAAGVLVVTSPVSATTEAVQQARTGLVAEVDLPLAWVVALRQLGEDNQLAESLRAAARRWVEDNYDAHRNTAQLAACFAEAMNG